MSGKEEILDRAYLSKMHWQTVNRKRILESMCVYAQQEAIGFSMWLQSLAKSGYPKNENGTMKDIWQLYEYWNNVIDKDPYNIHANGFKTFKP